MTYSCGMREATAILESNPEEAADQIFAAHRHEGAWLDAFTQSLDRRRAGESLERTLRVWGVSQAEAARLLGVSRQAVGKWLERGAPAARVEALADLSAATELLVRYLKRDRIPAVVRRPMPAVGGVSLMDLLARGDTRSLLRACRDMFRFENVPG